MSNFKRKLRRNIAKQQGLPAGFYCQKMQNKIAVMGDIRPGSKFSKLSISGINILLKNYKKRWRGIGFIVY